MRLHIVLHDSITSCSHKRDLSETIAYQYHAGGYMFDDCMCISLPMVVMNGEQREVNIASACSRAI